MSDPQDRPTKRPKLSPDQDKKSETSIGPSLPNLASLRRSITPPPHRLPRKSIAVSPHHEKTKKIQSSNHQARTQSIPSPIQLTQIQSFGPSHGNNVDTVRLRDILGDPLIRECWQFNYLIDVDFLMGQFDSDVRDLVNVKVVHGSWKRESDNRIRVDEACARYKNVEAIVAYMPEPFGTHHSKMMVLLRHDDLAQVIIHTANMIAGDWANMTQAVWRSPFLPLVAETGPGAGMSNGDKSTTWGSGARFKRDLLAYLKEYGVKKTGPLVAQLTKYDFSAVRAALVASVPSKLKLDTSNSNAKTAWGWPALKDALRHIPLRESDKTPHIVSQMSSIATLGQTDKWLKETFFSALSSPPPLSNPPKKHPTPKPQYSIIFPTAEEIRRSLNGYASGGSIHMKLQSAAQQKQLQYLKPHLRHWAGDVAEEGLPLDIRDAGRRRAAPHIKTYVRFTDERMESIDWALVTSANLSTQAWGNAVNKEREVRICSWEVGVLVWPGLFAEGRVDSAMVPCFKKDDPGQTGTRDDGGHADVVVGFRMPYDLPLTSYSAQDIPWCATMPHEQPDWLGQAWVG